MVHILGGINAASPVDWGDPLNRELLAWWKVMPWNLAGGSNTWQNLTKWQGNTHDAHPQSTGVRFALESSDGQHPGGFGEVIFDGNVGDNFAVGNPPDGRFQITKRSAWGTDSREMTISFWAINRYLEGDASDGRIIAKDNGTAAVSHLFMVSASSSAGQKRYRFRLKRGGTTTYTLLSDPGTIWPDGEWIHVICMADNGNLYIYADGVLVGTSTGGGGGTIPTGHFGKDTSIGETSIVGGGGNPWGGSIDDIRIWSRALSLKEINQIRDETNPYAGLSRIRIPFSVGLGQTVSVAAISASTAIIAPDRVDQTLDVGSVAAATAVVAPSVSVGQVVSVAAISASTAVIAPDRVDQTVDVGATGASTSILVPDVSTGQTVSVAAISASVAVIAPDRVDQTVVVPSTEASTTIVSPNRVDQTVNVSAMGAAAAIIAPDRVDQTVDVGSVSAPTAVIAPDRVDQTVIVLIIDVTVAIIAPTIVFDQVVTTPSIGAATTIIAPTIDVGIVGPAIVSQDLLISTASGDLLISVAQADLKITSPTGDLEVATEGGDLTI